MRRLGVVARRFLLRMSLSLLIAALACLAPALLAPTAEAASVADASSTAHGPRNPRRTPAPSWTR